MSQFTLIIITKNQKNLSKAEKLAIMIDSILDIDCTYDISKYYKYTDSYKIEIKGKIENRDLIFQAVELTDRLCSPWLIYFERIESTVNLIFNKADHSNFRKSEFNVIEWCNFEIDY